MNWLVLVPVIVQYGLPFAEKLFEKWSSGGPVTSAELAELKTLAAQNATNVMLARLQAAGIDPASDQGKVLLGLTA